MEGQILGNRYELIEKIGGGGMALVYKARCNLLNRYVAVKILRSEFTNDEEFVKRFRIEAQSAASLSHPNIVSIYDVGRENNIHYIVMEYVDGVTLKEYIKNNTSLDWKEAVNIAIQICSAIEHAHRKRIVHRDIKPHNILMTKEGIAKVTDFGIARAVSSSTITMVGSTIGSVHYFSPEQARGGFTDEKSDLYSIGIALYEMVTGKVPFDGDTPVAVALKHLQVDAMPPCDIKKDIPIGVNDIIMKAIEKDQNRRYQTASEMLEDLSRVLRDPWGGIIASRNVDNFPTRRMQTVENSDDGEKEEKMKAGNSGNDEKRKEKLTWIFAIATSLIIIGVFIFITVAVIVPSIVNNNAKTEIALEDYSKKNINEVKAELEGKNITVKENRKNDEDIPKDEIISQDPKPGTKIKPDAYNVVTFDVSDGPKLIKIPDFRKSDSREVQRELLDMELNPRVEDEHNEEVVSGYVIRTEPGMDEEVPPGTSVTIYKSIGPEKKQTLVPNLIGKTMMDAQKLLSDAKLKVGTVSPEDGSNYIDKIISQYPLPETSVNEGTAVNITYESNSGSNNGNNNNNNNNNNGGGSSQNMRTEKINLLNPEQYGDSIKVVIEAKPTDSDKSIIIMNEMKNKAEFPISVEIPVPQNGKTYVKVYLDENLRQELTVE